MELRILGCHGGETPKHKTSSFLLDGRVGLDAGAVTSMLTLEEQKKIDACLVSHAHLDHIKDLATLAEANPTDRSGAGCRRIEAQAVQVVQIRGTERNPGAWNVARTARNQLASTLEKRSRRKTPISEENLSTIGE